MSTDAWQYRQDPDGIGVLTLDVPGKSANTLSAAVLEDLARVLDGIERAPPKGLLIRSGKPGGFIAGADINEFLTFGSREGALQAVLRGQRLFDRLAALPFPTVAVIQGYAVGGGMELVLACTYRVGIDDGKLALGLPEVQLGIHPGFGGSVRSVELVGVRRAMDMMLTGKNIRGTRARQMGLIDALVPAEQADQAARQLLLRRPPRHRPPLTERVLSWPGVRGFIAPALERQVAARVRREHYPAPYAIVDLWKAHGARGRAAYEAEAQSISSLFDHPTTRNLIRVFQLQDRLKGIGAKAAGSAPRISHVHVVGAGLMGGDIAAWCALRGYTVSLQDRGMQYVEPALARAAELFGKRAHDAADRAAMAERLVADVEGTRVPDADLVIEAIFENLEAKRALYATLLPRMKPTAVLATNTSSLVLESLAEGMADASRFVGLHFFNPVAQMPLVEIIEGPSTSATTMAAAAAFVRRIDKLPLPCRSAPGFLVNRVLIPYMQEGMIAVEQGIPPEVVDAAATRFGMPMGPIELSDVVGLDVCKHVGEIIGAAIGRTPPLPLHRIESLVAAKQLGRKSGQGYYRWVEGKAVKQPVDESAVSAELTDRLILTMVNECVAARRLGLVADADLVDAGVIFGAGFAPFRGGPLHWARAEGTAALRGRLERLLLQHGSRFTPDPGWSGL
ncbi:MAG TPA: 3-hydroxyacyl-CoA dehydrogenase NAD-binding domain-containing protein [Steroidobacteraceae bacterium]|nr:3-hydroxyacyl-CoA dehydrogenase NAD-binding domain-containing protein [Steroidobacteraceae bacterium]